MTGRTRSRSVVIAGWYIVVAAAIVAPALALHGRLPDPMATHWDAAGRPDGSTSRGVEPAVIFLVWTGAVVLMALLARRSTRHGLGSGGAGALLGFTGALLAIVQVTTVVANLDRSRWQDAGHFGWPQATAIIVVGLVCGALGLVIDRRTAPGSASRPAVRHPVLELAGDERAAWWGRVASRPMQIIGAATMAAGGVTGLLAWATKLPHGWSIAPGLLVIGFIVLYVGSVRVLVDRRGVQIAFGPWAWPTYRIRLARIASASARRLGPMQVGGWGIRGLPGSTVIMLRGGDCLELKYHTGGNLTISVDDADSGAALINTLRAQATPRP